MRMYFDDFVRVVRAHRSPNSSIYFLSYRYGLPNTVTIVDYALPYRQGLSKNPRLSTESDWNVCSYVCNVTKGELPPYSTDGLWQEARLDTRTGEHSTPFWWQKPVLGYKQAFNELLGAGSIVPSHQLDMLLDDDTRRHRKYGNNLLYDKCA